MTSRAEIPERSLSLFPFPATLIALIAFAAVAPMLFLGTPSGHDFEFHLNSWLEVLGQWRQGILYPRWASMAHYGYGEARFLFYPPASWMLGASLGALLPWKVVPGVFNWIALALAGWSMFLLARRWFSRPTATFAALLYTANPYHLVIVYWRSAFAELLASSLLPLLLLLTLQIPDKGRKTLFPLALLIAAAWLTNAPSAVMIHYSFALLLIVVAFGRKSPQSLLWGGLAVFLGAALAAFYLVPAAYEEKWVNIAEVLSPGLRPQDNFLFTVINDPDHNRFNLLVSIVAFSEMIVAGSAALLSYKWRRDKRELWTASLCWTTLSILLLFPFTFFFWEHMPKLRFVQLPWRWLLCLNIGVALLIPMAWRRWFSRLAMSAALVVVVFLVWHRVQAPWWDHAPDIVEIRDSVREGPGYEGTDEYVPAGADPYEIDKKAPLVRTKDNVKARIKVEQWSAESKMLTANAAEPTQLILKLFNYPSWTVLVNGRPLTSQTAEVTGQMIVPIEGGRNIVKIYFARTWDRTLGGIISLCAIAVLAVDIYSRRRVSRRVQ